MLIRDIHYYRAAEDAKDDFHYYGIRRTDAEVEAEAERYRKLATSCG